MGCLACADCFVRGKPAGKKWNKGKLQSPSDHRGARLPPLEGLSRGQSPRRRLPIRGLAEPERPEGALRGHYSTSSTQNPCKYTRGGCIGPIPEHPHRAAASAAGWGRVPAAPLRRTAPRSGGYIRPAAVQSAGRSPGIRAGLPPCKASTALSPWGSSRTTARPSLRSTPAQKRQHRALQKRGARRRQQGICAAEIQPPGAVGGQLPRGGTAHPILRSAPAHGRVGAQSGPRQSTPAAARV